MCSALFSVFRSLMAALSFRVCEYVLLCCNQHSPRQGVIVVRSQEHVTQIQGPLPRSRAWENYLLSCRPAFIICNVEGLAPGICWENRIRKDAEFSGPRRAVGIAEDRTTILLLFNTRVMCSWGF